MFETMTRMGASAAGAYEIEKSLRFNSADSATFTRTFGTPTDTDKYTFSCWLKRTKFHDSAGHFGLLGNGGWSVVRFSADRLYWRENGIVNITITRKLRDPSSWYHIVLRYDSSLSTSSDRAQIWINGVRETEFVSASYPSQNQNSFINSAIAQVLGGYTTSEQFTDGYLADINFIDGQGLDPDNFGETDATTGSWIPKKYEGTYGDNGYHLKFDDTSALGTDSSGNSNNWTPNNFSVSAGVGNDSVTDTPTNNYPTLNPVDGYSSVTYTPYNGALDFSISDNSAIGLSTISIPTSGKWYAELTVNALESVCFGIRETQFVSYSNSFETGILYLYTGHTWKNNSNIESVTAPSSGNIMGCAVDRDNNTVQFSLNGTNVGNTIAMTTTDEYQWWVARGASSGGSPTGSVNFGQRAFSHQPTGFVGLCTSELPTPTIKKGSDYFNTVLYTGNDAATHAITGVGFQPDLLWLKRRSHSKNHFLVDSVRGATTYMQSDSTDEDSTNATTVVKSLDSDGFTLGSYDGTNGDGKTFVSWNWKESASAGFDIVSYTGTGSNPQTRAHSLGVVPEMIIVKNRSGTNGDEHWVVYHHGLQTDPEDYFGRLNTNGAFENLEMWNDTVPTSSVFTTQNHAISNYNGDTFIAYLFASVKGYSKVGSFLGNGNASGPFVYTGFRPSFVMIKNASTGHWYMWDSTRQTTNEAEAKVLWANYVGEAEGDHTAYAIDFLSNGFKVRNTESDTNTSGSTQLYLAIAETPFKYANAR